MKFAWIALAILGFASGAPSGVRMEQLQDAKVRASDSRWQLHLFQAFDHITRQVKWHTFKEVFAKTYGSIEEDRKREAIFEENLRQIRWHNFQYAIGMKSYSLQVNEFADITNEEFWGTRSCLHRKEPSLDCTLCSSYLRLNLANELPPSVDWRQEGYVTDVKNQETCGSCWAFSSTGSLEGQYFRKTGNLVSMSEQNLVDCSRDCNHGCSGGTMDYAFDYVKRNGGIDSEASYPYTGEFGQCEYTESGEVTSVTGCMAVPSGDESALQEAVATVGPVSVAIDANHKSFQFYSQGVYEEDQCSTIKLNHAVLVVGYGQLQDVDYWIVKNSWGTSWGDEGYILMSRNKDNMCGIASHAVYPLL